VGWAVRRPVVALVAWVMLLVGLGVAAVSLAGKPNDSFALPGVQSTTAQNLLEGLGEAGPSAPSGRVVWSPASGTVTDAANKAAAVALLRAIADEPFVTCVTGPFDENYGRRCPKPAPADYEAAVYDAAVAAVAKELGIPKARVAGVVALINRVAPLKDASPEQLAAAVHQEFGLRRPRRACTKSRGHIWQRVHVVGIDAHRSGRAVENRISMARSDLARDNQDETPATIRMRRFACVG